MPDMLPDFFELMLRIPLQPAEAIHERWLFPLAIQMPGWRHIFDLILRRSLSSMPWFPRWLDIFKSLCSFLRDLSVQDQLCRSLRGTPFAAAVQVIKLVTIPGFAKWRWTTLDDCCSELFKIWATFRRVFNPQHFANMREDGTRLQRVVEAVHNEIWNQQLKFVRWHADWLGKLGSWCGGCDIHGRQPCDGSNGCRGKGKRLPSASAHLARELARGLAEANAWHAAEFGGYAEVLQHAQGCARAAHHLATLKTAWVDKIPYLFARLREPGVKAMCLDQWHAVPMMYHHRFSVAMMQPGGILRADFDRFPDDGLSHALEEAIEGVATIPMDDSVAEGPHAKVEAVSLASRRRGTWEEWTAASMRLDQNLEDIDTLVPAVGADLQREWNRWSSILQPPSLAHRKNGHERRFLNMSTGWIGSTKRLCREQQAMRHPGLVPEVVVAQAQETMTTVAGVSQKTVKPSGEKQ